MTEHGRAEPEHNVLDGLGVEPIEHDPRHEQRGFDFDKKMTPEYIQAYTAAQQDARQRTQEMVEHSRKKRSYSAPVGEAALAQQVSTGYNT